MFLKLRGVSWGLLEIQLVKMKIQILVVKLIVLGALFIISNQNLHLAVAVERDAFFDAYSSWITNIVSQFADVTGYVVRFDWLPSLFQPLYS